jgi:hypothetical protein
MRLARTLGSAAAIAATTVVMAPEPTGAAPDPVCADIPVNTKARLGKVRARQGNLMDPTVGAPGFGFYAVTKAAPEPGPPAVGAPLNIALKGSARVKVGEPLHLRATVENVSARNVILARAVDGSLEHWRSPFVDLLIKDAAGRVFRWDFQGARCGNVNQRHAGDFVTLAAGAKREGAFGEWAGHLDDAVIDAPGRYTAWVVYSSCTGVEHGVPLGAAAASLPTPFLGVLISAPVTFDVVAK